MEFNLKLMSLLILADFGFKYFANISLFITLFILIFIKHIMSLYQQNNFSLKGKFEHEYIYYNKSAIY